MVTKLRKVSKAIQEVFGTRPKELDTTTLSANIGGIITEVVVEKVDDIGVLIGLMVKMGLQEVLDKHIPTHWKQRQLSWGWTILIWLAYVISEGDHRKISMESYVTEMVNTLSELTGQQIDPKDFADDRLSNALKYLSKGYWNKIEKELNERTINVYDLEAEVVRLDATSVAGNQPVVPEGLIQFGHHKDGTLKPQFKIMVAGLDPIGMPLATQVVSGEQADDELYVPIIKLVDESLNKKGLLYVGDCKMSAFETRVYIVHQENHYLSPLPLTGKTTDDMETWIDIGVEKDLNCNLEMVRRQDDCGNEILIAAGYEFERTQSGIVDEKEVQWTERVLVIKSLAHASGQVKELEKRIDNAIEEIKKLTPPRGRGKRQITSEEHLKAEIEKVLKKQQISPELLDIDYEKQVEKLTKYVGRGRGSENRAKKVIKKVRFSIKSVKRDGGAIDEAKERFGWKAFVTSLPQNKLSLSQAVINYRHEYRIERIFNRLKSDLNIAPRFVKRNDQIKGLANLLSLGVRVLTVIEYVVRRSLQQDNAQLPDLHPENRQKETDKPTAKRLLSAFSNTYLLIIKSSLFGEIFRYLTPLSKLQEDIIGRLGLDIFLYLKLEIIKS